MTSPTAETTKTITALHKRLAAEEPIADTLAACLLQWLDTPRPEHAHHLGNPDVCCAMEARRLAGPLVRQTTDAIEAWQQARTGGHS